MTSHEEILEENKLIALRRQKLSDLRQIGNAYPTDFRRDAWRRKCTPLRAARDSVELEAEPRRVVVAGRMLAKRIMGKASFRPVA
jgi:lysyl-tRNA synthetase class 2